MSAEYSQNVLGQPWVRTIGNEWPTLSPLVYRMDLFAVHCDSDVVELVEALRTRLYVELAPGGNDFAQRLRIRSGVLRHPVLRRGPSCLEEP